MGLMQGKLDGDTFIVMDAFALPVVGTETRVNAANEANEFMIQYIESSPAVSGRNSVEHDDLDLQSSYSVPHNIDRAT